MAEENGTSEREGKKNRASPRGEAGLRTPGEAVIIPSAPGELYRHPIASAAGWDCPLGINHPQGWLSRPLGRQLPCGASSVFAGVLRSCSLHKNVNVNKMSSPLHFLSSFPENELPSAHSAQFCFPSRSQLFSPKIFFVSYF